MFVSFRRGVERSCVRVRRQPCHRLDLPTLPPTPPLRETWAWPNLPGSYVACLSPTIWLPVRPCCHATMLRHQAFFLFLLFFCRCFVFFQKFWGNAQLVSALVQYNNANVRLPDFFFLLKARLERVNGIHLDLGNNEPNGLYLRLIFLQLYHTFGPFLSM